MAAVVTAPTSSRPSGRLGRPLKSRTSNRALLQQQQQDAEDESLRRYQAAEESSRYRAFSFLEDFLQRSQWQDQLDQIGIAYAAVPTMEVLQSYGELAEAEGTRACAKLFKAVVIWDQLGHSLWTKLSLASDQRRKALEGLSPLMNFRDAADQLPLSHYFIQEQQPYSTPPPPPATSSSSRHSRRSSRDSGNNNSTRSRRSSRGPHPPCADNQNLHEGKTYKILGTPRSSSVPAGRRKAGSCESCGGWHDDRRGTDPNTTTAATTTTTAMARANSAGKDGPVSLPKMISQNCANAVRRVWGKSSS